MSDPSIAAAYDQWASSYDLEVNRTRDLDRQTLRALLADRSFAHTVEAGCGTGKNTAWLAERSRRVTAQDISTGMLAMARQKLCLGHVAFVQADLQVPPWPVPTAVADLVTFNLVLEHVADLGPVLAEAARVLRPGGTLCVCEWHPFRQYQGKQANFQRDGVVTRVPAFVHHVSDYLAAAQAAGLTLCELREAWHSEDAGRPPRLLALRWQHTG